MPRIISNHNIRFAARLGLGVHRTFPNSLTLAEPSQLDPCRIASARLAAEVPRPAVLSSNLLAAGVKRPGCDRGVVGVDVVPWPSRFPNDNESFDGPGVPESRDALARKDREAVEESL